MEAFSFLTSSKLILVFAVAPAGLGHLRVTDALYHGLPPGVKSTLLGSQDERITYIHKLTSTNVVLRRIFEWVQNGWAQDVFTVPYRSSLRRDTDLLSVQLQTIMEQHVEYPKTILVVATHFGLAHQLAAIKDTFAKKHGVRVVLIVVVTDDSPQHLWAVGGADFIVVPSETTRKELAQYHQQQHLPPAEYVVLPYMVSPRLGTVLSSDIYMKRKKQVDPTAQTPLHVAIPVSGAAVQLMYFDKFIEQLAVLHEGARFHIVSKQSAATGPFLQRMLGKPDVELLASAHDKEVIELYETLYQKDVIALEVTKPSEQAFKALLTPHQRGGSILLFTQPVGRQEWDNLAFLERHNLIPTQTQHEELWLAAQKHREISKDLAVQAVSWRGVRLPLGSSASAVFVHWSWASGLFAAMMKFGRHAHHAELSSDGVHAFWKRVEAYLSGTPLTAA